jgi:hypothetical protein
VQILMAEDDSIREVLIDQLAGIKDPAASVALAKRALYDLEPSLRKKALETLRKRPVAEYRDVLVDGFRYPWPAVADHAAEAVVALSLTETVPTLRSLLDELDPTAPFEKPDRGTFVREVVKINHLRNCLLCHDTSSNPSDPVRGRVPFTDESTKGPVKYSGRTRGIFVRADVTYLKQDFSVMLDVKEHGDWPALQRFDFLVRERWIDPDDLSKPLGVGRFADSSRSPHKQALRFALRELTADRLARK